MDSGFPFGRAGKAAAPWPGAPPVFWAARFTAAIEATIAIERTSRGSILDTSNILSNPFQGSLQYLIAHECNAFRLMRKKEQSALVLRRIEGGRYVDCKAAHLSGSNLLIR
jgi:hypothetical protein